MVRRIQYLLIMLILTARITEASVVVVPIHGTIDGGLAAFIERSLSEAEQQGAEAVIFHVDTPGGRIDSAVRIKDVILSSRVTTVAFVDKNAISAGALISFACDSLYMSTGASIGAATAVDLQGNKASEKIISYFRAQMRATAEAKGRRADIAEAMVDEQLEIEGISPKGMLLTLTYKEALGLGISNATVESVEDVAVHLGYDNTPIVKMHVNWAENVVRFLTHPVVSSLLMSIGFLGLLIEIRTPGWGIGGTIGLIALALFFGSHYIVNLASIGELLVFTAGIILLALEVFVIPGFGIAGIAGITLIFASLYLSLVGRIPQPDDYIHAAYTFTGAFFIAILGVFGIIKFFPKTAMFRKLTLDKVESADNGFASAVTDSELIGVQGTAISDLRPAGKALINGKRMDVVTEGGYIAKDCAIVVTEVHGSRIIVREN